MFMKTRRLKSQQLAHMRWKNLPSQVETQSPKGDFAVVGAVLTAV